MNLQPSLFLRKQYFSEQIVKQKQLLWVCCTPILNHDFFDLMILKKSLMGVPYEYDTSNDLIKKWVIGTRSLSTCFSSIHFWASSTWANSTNANPREAPICEWRPTQSCVNDQNSGSSLFTIRWDSNLWPQDDYDSQYRARAGALVIAIFAIANLYDFEQKNPNPRIKIAITHCLPWYTYITTQNRSWDTIFCVRRQWWSHDHKTSQDLSTCLFFPDQSNVFGEESIALDVVTDVRFGNVLS